MAECLPEMSKTLVSSPGTAKEKTYIYLLRSKLQILFYKSLAYRQNLGFLVLINGYFAVRET